MGQPHGLECVVVTKLVELRVEVREDAPAELAGLTGTWLRREPHYWQASNVEFFYNDGRWCCDNVLDLRPEERVRWSRDLDEEVLRKAGEDSPWGCLCGVLRFKLARVVDETPHREVNPCPPPT